MTKSTKKPGLVVKSSLKSGAFSQNHNRRVVMAKKSGLTVKTGMTVGAFSQNHTTTLISSWARGRSGRI